MGLFALIISVLSSALSLYTFANQHFNRLYRLGISADNFMPNIKEEILFARITFINESSTPLTIYDTNILDENGKIFAGNDGQLIFEKRTVSSFFRTGISVMTDESTSLLPITIAPYSYSSSFYAFFLSGESAETIYNKSTYYLETETSHGLFVNKLTTFSFNFEYETRYNKSRLMRIYWHQSKWRKFFNPEFQNKLKLPKLVKIKRNKEQ